MHLYVHRLSLPDLYEDLKIHVTREVYNSENGMDKIMERIHIYSTPLEDEDHVPISSLMKFIHPLLKRHEEELSSEFPDRVEEFKARTIKMERMFYEQF